MDKIIREKSEFSWQTTFYKQETLPDQVYGLCHNISGLLREKVIFSPGIAKMDF